MIAYDIHKPKQKTKNYLINYYRKKGLVTDNLLFVKNQEDWIKLTKLPGVDLICFNKNQEFFWYRDSTQCNAPGFNYSEQICNSQVPIKRVNKNFKLDSLLSFAECFDGSSPKIDSADYSVVITCARYSGRLNKDHIKVWEENLRKSNCKVQIYKLCTDPLKEWEKYDIKVNRIKFW